MGRRNKRYSKRPREPIVIVQNTKQPKMAMSRCAYCGRLLGSREYHYIYDEFGQRVRKCNDETRCAMHRKEQAEEAYIEAIKRNRKLSNRKLKTAKQAGIVRHDTA